jgi:hypothetical protein
LVQGTPISFDRKIDVFRELSIVGVCKLDLTNAQICLLRHPLLIPAKVLKSSNDLPNIKAGSYYPGSAVSIGTSESDTWVAA